jgi:2-oxoisovalerate dehydrogenase E1 component alpha subunit
MRRKGVHWRHKSSLDKSGKHIELALTPEFRICKEAPKLARHHDLGLSDDDVLKMHRVMLTARTIDERASILVRQSKIDFTVGGQGQEAAQVGAAWALTPGKDWALPYYRDLGVMLTLGMTPLEALLGEFGKAGDPNSSGRQMPKHWSSKRLRVAAGSSPVATQLPHAVGCALAARLQGEDAVAWVSFGDGAVSKGDFHEALNFAAIHHLPVVFFCENNLYAISVPFRLQSPVPRVADRAAAYNMPGVAVDGNNIFDVYAATRAAVERARSGDGPTLIEAQTYRTRHIPQMMTTDDIALVPKSPGGRKKTRYCRCATICCRKDYCKRLRSLS